MTLIALLLQRPLRDEHRIRKIAIPSLITADLFRASADGQWAGWAAVAGGHDC